MGRDIRDAVRLGNDAVGIDQIGPPFGEARGALLRAAPGLVQLSDRSIDVGQQPEGKAMSVGEGPVLLGGIERDTQDLDRFGVQIWGSVPEPLQLDGSTARERLGEPPHRHPPASKVGQ
jgi:hypothetical protein